VHLHLHLHLHTGPWCQAGEATEMARLDLLLLLDLLGGHEPQFHNVVVGTETGACDPWFAELAGIEEAMVAACPSCMPGRRQFHPSCVEPDHVLDDHVPFLEKGLRRAVHVIASPFPLVWHTMEDDREHLDWPNIHWTNAVLRVFLAELLHVEL